jgi:chromosome partitioning protein
MPLAQEARKPMFLLKPGDGAFGGHQQAVSECYRSFRSLTDSIVSSCDVGPAPF